MLYNRIFQKIWLSEKMKIIDIPNVSSRVKYVCTFKINSQQ